MYRNYYKYGCVCSFVCLSVIQSRTISIKFCTKVGLYIRAWQIGIFLFWYVFPLEDGSPFDNVTTCHKGNYCYSSLLNSNHGLFHLILIATIKEPFLIEFIWCSHNLFPSLPFSTSIRGPFQIQCFKCSDCDAEDRRLSWGGDGARCVQGCSTIKL